MNLLVQTKKPLIPFKYIFLVLIFIVFTMFSVIPMKTKLYTNSIYRLVVKTEMNIKTWNWYKIEGQHFIVKYQSSDKNIANMVLKNAEDNFLPVTEKFNYYPQGKTLIIVYPDKQSLSKSFGWSANETAQGVYWEGVIRILSPNSWITSSNAKKEEKIFASKGPIAHEFTHLVVDYLTKGNYTRWFTEGIAQYNEYLITGYKLPNDEFDVNKLYSLKDMDDNYDNLPDQSLAYRESLVAAEYIVDNYGTAKLNDIMTQLGKGYTMDQALINVIGVNQKQFESNMHNWLENNMNEMM